MAKMTWTENEDRILSLAVKSNSTISNAFKEASGITGRSIGACSARYYNHIKNSEYFLAMFAHKKTFWDKVIDFFLK